MHSNNVFTTSLRNSAPVALLLLVYSNLQKLMFWTFARFSLQKMETVKIDNLRKIDRISTFLAYYFWYVVTRIFLRINNLYCNKFAGSISQWKFITLNVQYTTVDHN
jgi:hypothetical protein